METWFLMILGSAIALGLYDFCKKVAVNGNSVMPSLFFATCIGTGFLITVTVCRGEFAATFQCTPGQWLLVLLKATIVAFSWIAGYFALHDLPISIAAPVRASAPLWVLVGGVLIYGERPGWLRLLGILLVFGSYFMFINLGKLEGFSWKHRGVWMVIAATLIGASSALYDRFLMKTLNLDADMVQLHFSINLLLVLGAAWALQRYLPFMKEDHKFHWRWSIICIGILLIVADWLFFHAIAQPDTQIGVLSVLRRCSVVVSFVTGAMVYREKRLGGKALALLLMLAGVIIIALA
jgi:transporter family protein